MKNSSLLNISPAISITKDTLSKTLTKSELEQLSPIDDDRPLITRTATTNLTKNNDDDDDNEQLKRNSLGLARDSIELIRNATPHHHNSNDEQLIPHANIDTTPNKRKSVLKPHLDSSDILPTPDLISYVAIDEFKDDKRLMEKQMRYDF